MKRASEAELGKALRDMDLEPFVYKPPDDARNWKPCDFMVWWKQDQSDRLSMRIWLPQSAWVEAKDTDAVDVFPFAGLRASQVAGIREAARLGIPYLLAVYWRRAKRWTISDAVRVLAWFEDIGGPGREPTSIPRTLLMSRFGVDAGSNQLGMTLKVILEDGF